MKRLRLQLVLLCCLLQFLLVHSLAMHSNNTDMASLLSIKAELTNGLDVLRSWNESAHFCEWKGVTCGRRHPQRVTRLDLSKNDLAGSIPPFIGNLTFLKTINLTTNKLNGEIPQSISFLHRLENLDFSNNSFGGRISIGLHNCTNLVSMDFSNNNLGGEIPSWFGSLSKLKYLRLNTNNLIGTIPLSLNNLSSLHVLYLYDNNLEGTIPEGLGFLPMLQQFIVSENHLSGNIPHSFFNQSSLISIFVTANELEGNLPVNIPINLPNLQHLVLAKNNFTGPIPSWISNLSNINMLYLGDNKFSGKIPPELGKLCPSYFDVGINELEPTNTAGWNFLRCLSNCSHLTVLGLNNCLRGVFPNYIANLTQLRQLAIASNHLSGSIPDEIGNLVNMELLFLYENSLTGIIPESVGKLQQLQNLQLYTNRLSGPLPSSIGNLTKLSILFAYDNSIQGHIPSNLANLQNLIELDLTNNFLDGTLPKSIFNLTWTYLFLSNNSLTGKLPIGVKNLQLLSLDLSQNKFYGEPSESLNDYESLEYLGLSDNLFNGTVPLFLGSKALLELNLSNNNFYGIIPQELSNLHGLQLMDLSHNNLFGNIPVLLENLSFLFTLDLSFNHLNGPVPTKGISNNFSGLSITGNAALCGGIPQLLLPKCSNQHYKKEYSLLFIILIALPCIVIVLVSLITVILILRKRVKPRERETSCVLLEKSYPKVSYAELVEATEGFSSANLLGAGQHGSVYKGILPSKHKQTQYHAIKVFNVDARGTSNNFLAECDALKRICHRNLVGIKTCCSSTDFKGNEFKALVFDFMPNGSLDRWLHQQGDLVLSFMERLNIAIDVADAIDYLHNYCDPLIVHCDLKPGNILLGEDFTAHVSDFGLAKLLPNSGSAQMMNSESSVGIRGSIGYITPEYWAGVPVSTWGDVYSFGIILLEMFTGKMPVDDMFKDGLTLHTFAERSFPDNLHDIVDPKLILFESDSDLEIQNEHNGDSWNKIRKFFTLVIRVGLLCSMHSPTDRKSIRDAAAELHYIRDAFIRSR